MVDKGTGFAKFSKNLCWIVSFIAVLLSILTFTGDEGSSMVNGFLWLGLAFAFAISAIFLSKNETANDAAASTDSSSE